MQRLGLAAILVLAGCAGNVYGGGSGLNEVVMKRTNDDFAPPARGYVGVALRAFAAGPDGNWVEVDGASCRVSAGPYRAVAASPARVVLPDLGPDAPPVQADCSTASASGSARVLPDFSWPQEAKPDAFNRIAYAGWWWGYEKSGPMRYPDLSVGMSPAVGG